MTTNNDNMRERIAALIAAALSGRMPPSEQKELDEWLSQDPRNRSLYEKFADGGTLAGNLRAIRSFDPAEASRQAAAKMKPPVRRLLRRIASCAAAGLALTATLFGLHELVRPYKIPTSTVFSSEISPVRSRARLTVNPGTTLVLGGGRHAARVFIENGVYHSEDSRIVYLNIEEVPVRWHTLETPRGGEYRLLLADGTAVTLGPSSRIRYPSRFEDGDRRVEIEGEAYVEVACEPEHPFRIAVDGDEITLGGTAYLKTYPGEPLQAALASGYAIVSSADGNVALGPGQELTRSHTGWHIGKCAQETIAAFRGDDFVFDGEQIESILKKLERWYDIHIYMESPSTREVRYTGSLPKYGDIETVLSVLGRETGVRFDLEGRSLLVAK